MFITLTLMACRLLEHPPDDPNILLLKAELSAFHIDMIAIRYPKNALANDPPSWKPENQYPWGTSENYRIRIEKHQVCARYKTGRPECAKRTPILR